jgi:hypothetical protein
MKLQTRAFVFFKWTGMFLILFGHQTVLGQCPTSNWCADPYKKFWYNQECSCCANEEQYIPTTVTQVWSCRLCPEGKLQANPSSSPCLYPCAIGFKGPAGACTLCELGKYKDWIGNEECKDCPANSISSYYTPDGVRDSIKDCGCDEGYTGPNGGPCTACNKGTYKDFLGDGDCKPCASGSVASSQGSKVCAQCGEGTYAGSGASICQQCATGKHTHLGPTKECLTDQMYCTLSTSYCGQGSTNVICHCCSGQLLSITGNIRKCVSCPESQYMPENNHQSLVCLT